MTLGEFRNLTASLPDDTDVWFSMLSGCCGDFEEMVLSEIDVEQPSQTFKTGFVRVEFQPLPGYRSCMQAGATLTRDKEWLDKFGKK
jgi:hypothetical protein